VQSTDGILYCRLTEIRHGRSGVQHLRGFTEVALPHMVLCTFGGFVVKVSLWFHGAEEGADIIPAQLFLPIADVILSQCVCYTLGRRGGRWG